MNVIDKDEDELLYDMKLHKCPWTKLSSDDLKERDYIERLYEDYSLTTFITTSFFFLLLGLFFVYVMKSTKLV